jgi:hypothetical protein
MTPIGRRSFAAADFTAAGLGSGGPGVAGALVSWVAGLLGL